jgi:hypothetical protein
MRTLIIASALLSITAGTACAQENEGVTGNGKIVTADVPVKSFDVLKASGVYELKLQQGDKESVKIEADENLQALFHVRNEGSSLIIEMGKTKNLHLKKGNHLTVYVTFKTLKSLDLNMVGNVRSQAQLSFADVKMNNNSVGNVNLAFTANRVELDNQSVGNVTLSGRAQNAIFHNEGVGNLEAGNLLAQSVQIENEGVGHAEVNAEKEFKVKDSFLGKVKNKGAAKAQKKEVI